MAMAAAVLGLRVPGVVIENVETTDKTLPGFAARWMRLLNRDNHEAGDSDRLHGPGGPGSR
jgi:hypothetical protein